MTRENKEPPNCTDAYNVYILRNGSPPATRENVIKLIKDFFSEGNDETCMIECLLPKWGWKEGVQTVSEETFCNGTYYTGATKLMDCHNQCHTPEPPPPACFSVEECGNQCCGEMIDGSCSGMMCACCN